MTLLLSIIGTILVGIGAGIYYFLSEDLCSSLSSCITTPASPLLIAAIALICSILLIFCAIQQFRAVNRTCAENQANASKERKRRRREKQRDRNRLKSVIAYAHDQTETARAKVNKAKQDNLEREKSLKKLLSQSQKLQTAYKQLKEQHEDLAALEASEKDALTKITRRYRATAQQSEQLLAENRKLLQQVIAAQDQNIDLEMLLARIIPKPVVQQLDGKVPDDSSVGKIATQKEQVHILFADIVDYTTTTEFKDPKALLQELHALFSEFDERAKHIGVEKIKTIGDCYMAATGLFTGGAEEVTKLLKFADAINNKAAAAGQWQLTIGIASGTVVAGILGRDKLLYDVWGHPVNLAARLQSAAKPDQILVSRVVKDAAQNTDHNFNFKAVEIKAPKGVAGKLTVYELVNNHSFS